MDFIGLATFVTSVAGLLTALTAAIVSLRNAFAIHAVEKSVNGRLTELLALTRLSSRAEGVREGEGRSTQRFFDSPGPPS